MQPIVIIAALGLNREIGIKSTNSLPWRLKNDMLMFKKQTTGHVVIMGRRTWESIGSKPLSNRINIVVSSSPEAREAVVAAGALAAPGLDYALKAAMHGASERRIYIIGGEQLYREAMPYANTMTLTEVEYAAPGADVFFPEYKASWTEVERTRFDATLTGDEHSFSMVVYIRNELVEKFKEL